MIQWRKHTGDQSPVPPSDMVWYHLENDEPHTVHGPARAGNLYWGPGEGDERLGRIDEWAPAIGVYR